MVLTREQSGLEHGAPAAFAAGLQGLRPEQLRLDVRAPRGGLRAVSVARVVARVDDSRGARAGSVVKRVDGGGKRRGEAAPAAARDWRRIIRRADQC